MIFHRHVHVGTIIQFSMWHGDSEENVGGKERTETSGRLPKLSSGTPPVYSAVTLQRCRQTERFGQALLLKEYKSAEAHDVKVKLGLGQHTSDWNTDRFHCVRLRLL